MSRGRTRGGRASARRSGPADPATLVAEPRVTTMFDSIAPVYDRMNTLMTAGLDGCWRRAAVTGGWVVALATPRWTWPAGRASSPSRWRAPLGRPAAWWVWISRRRCSTRPGVPSASWPASSSGSATPWRCRSTDGSFDAATIAFGLRNLSSFEDGFRGDGSGRPERRSRGLPGAVAASTRDRPVASTRPSSGSTAPVLGTLFRRRAAYSYLPHSLDGFPEGGGDRRHDAPGRAARRRVQAPGPGGRRAPRGHRGLGIAGAPRRGGDRSGDSASLASYWSAPLRWPSALRGMALLRSPAGRRRLRQAGGLGRFPGLADSALHVGPVELEQLRDRGLVDRHPSAVISLTRSDASTGSTGPPGVSRDSKGWSASRNQASSPPITRPRRPKKK